MRQDRASRAQHQSRATTERRPAAEAEARQASSSGPARGQRQPITRELFPAIHPPITSSTTPSPSRIGARAGAQGSPIPSDSHRAQARQADKGSEEPSRPSEDDARGRPSRRRDQGDARRTTTPEDRARRHPIPSDHKPMTVRGRTPHQTAHQRPPEAAGAAHGAQATRDSSHPRQSGRRPHKSPRSQANQPKRQEQEAHKRREPAAHKDDRPSGTAGAAARANRTPPQRHRPPKTTREVVVKTY